jgi:hypothetical protein
MDVKVDEIRLGNFCFLRSSFFILNKSIEITLGLVVAVTFFLVQCQPKNLSRPTTSSKTTEALSRLGNGYRTSFNSSHTYVILTEKEDVATIGKNIYFVVMWIADSVVVYEGSYHRGYVKWVDEKSIEKMNAPGKVQYDDDLSAYKEIIQIDHPLPKY